MATFIALLDYTDQGIRNIKDSPHRADHFNRLATDAGATIVSQYWTIGSHDGVLILEAPNCSAWAGPATCARRRCGRSSGPTRRN